MKENKYDEQKFFMKYSEMERSKKGLQGAGEWTELQKILPDFKDKKVLQSLKEKKALEFRTVMGQKEQLFMDEISVQKKIPVES